jgi:hypothetical protein
MLEVHMPSAVIFEHEVEIFIEETTTDSRGDVIKRPSTTSVTVRGRLSSRTTASDKSGSPELPRFALLAPIGTPLGKWSRVVVDGIEYAPTSWPRRVAEGHAAVEHVAVELVQQR